MLELVICNAKGDPLKRFSLSRLADVGEAVVIGRGEDCDVRIRHPSVSRRHAVLERPGVGEWRLRDLGSREGLVVRGERLDDVPVSEELEVKLGPALLRFLNAEQRLGEDLARELEEGVGGRDDLGVDRG